MSKIRATHGWKWQTKNGRFYVSIGGKAYVISISVGRVTVCIERSAKYFANARTRRCTAIPK